MAQPRPGKAEVLPLFPLATVLVPGMRLSLHVFEPRYRQLVADLLDGQETRTPEFGVVALRQGWEVGGLGEVHQVGTSARVTGVAPHPDGRCDLTAIGERRFTLDEVDTVSKPYLLGTVRWLAEPAGEPDEELADSVRRVLELHLRTLVALRADPGITDDIAEAVGNSYGLSYAVARLPSLPLADRQALLAAPDTAARLLAARSVLRRETELLRQLRAIPITAATFRRPGSS